eukprot:3689086-Prymnesium_polylepis.1
MYAADSTRAKAFSVTLLAFASRRPPGARAHCERCTRACSRAQVTTAGTQSGAQLGGVAPQPQQ